MARILIAQHEPNTRELVAFTVRFAGHEAMTVDNGEEALAVACETIPDLILLDTRLPSMNGYEVCRALKMSAILKEIPVVFLSAQGQQAEVRAGMEAGAAAYMLKPFSPDQLNERIHSILAAIGKGTEPEANPHIKKEDFHHLMETFRAQQQLRRETFERSERVQPLEKQGRRNSWKSRLKGFFSTLFHRQERK